MILTWCIGCANLEAPENSASAWRAGRGCATLVRWAALAHARVRPVGVRPYQRWWCRSRRCEIVRIKVELEIRARAKDDGALKGGRRKEAR